MKIIVNGALGRMGAEICKLAETSENVEIVAKVDINAKTNEKENMFSSLSEVTSAADCIIDFSHHSATNALVSYAVSKEIPVVVATTGHVKEELAEIDAAAKKIPVFHSGNMSVGIALLVKLAKTAALAFPQADIEIIEKHHNRKLDVPSGTALMLGCAVKEVRKDAELLVGRHENGKRQNSEIGIHSIRMGNIVGEHEVIIGTDTQTITLKHEAHSRSLFAEGAFEAAKYLVKQNAGLYNMQTMLGD